MIPLLKKDSSAAESFSCRRKILPLKKDSSVEERFFWRRKSLLSKKDSSVDGRFVCRRGILLPSKESSVEERLWAPSLGGRIPPESKRIPWSVGRPWVLFVSSVCWSSLGAIGLFSPLVVLDCYLFLQSFGRPMCVLFASSIFWLSAGAICAFRI